MFCDICGVKAIELKSHKRQIGMNLCNLCWDEQEESIKKMINTIDKSKIPTGYNSGWFTIEDERIFLYSGDHNFEDAKFYAKIVLKIWNKTKNQLFSGRPAHCYCRPIRVVHEYGCHLSIEWAALKDTPEEYLKSLEKDINDFLLIFGESKKKCFDVKILPYTLEDSDEMIFSTHILLGIDHLIALFFQSEKKPDNQI